MGIKQMGLTVGGVISALVLPTIAALLDWRAAVATCAVVIAAPALTSWRRLAPLAAARPIVATGGAADDESAWWWASRPALLIFFATGVALGMLQSAVLAYLPLYGVQVLGWGAVGAGALVAAAQAGGAVARLALGAASDRWLGGRRPPWLVLSSLLGALVFAAYALTPVRAALAGVRARLRRGHRRAWLGRRVLHRERRGGRPASLRAAQRRGLRRHRAGAARRARPCSASCWMLTRLLRRGLARLRRLAAGVALAMAVTGEAIHRECARARAEA